MTIDMEAELIHEDYLSRESIFKELKQHFIKISGPHVTKEVLDHLKEYYAEVIASKREKDRVKNLEDLLRILEKRDLLRYNAIEPLKQIANECIRDSILNRALDNYEARLKDQKPLPVINHYKYRGEYFEGHETEYLIINRHYNQHTWEKNDELSIEENNSLDGSKCSFNSHHAHISTSFSRVKSMRCKRTYSLMIIAGFLLGLITIFMHCNNQSSAAERPSTSQTTTQPHAVNFYTNQPLPVVSYAPPASSPWNPGPSVQEKVFQRVSENLGKSWRDVARFLSVKECEIDGIEAKSYLGTKEKAYEALLIFKSRCDSCDWRKKMYRALEKARRKDLAEVINEIGFPDDY